MLNLGPIISKPVGHLASQPKSRKVQSEIWLNRGLFCLLRAYWSALRLCYQTFKLEIRALELQAQNLPGWEEVDFRAPKQNPRSYRTLFWVRARNHPNWRAMIDGVKKVWIGHFQTIFNPPYQLIQFTLNND